MHANMHTHAQAEALIEFLALCRLHYQPIIDLDSPDCTLRICVWRVREKQCFALLKQGEGPVKHSVKYAFLHKNSHSQGLLIHTAICLISLSSDVFLLWCLLHWCLSCIISSHLHPITLILPVLALKRGIQWI